MLHSSIIIQKIAIGMLACQWRFLNYELSAYTRILLFPKWGEFTGSGENGTFAKC